MIGKNFIASTIVLLQLQDASCFTGSHLNQRAFNSVTQSSLHFGIPTFGAKDQKDDSSDDSEPVEKKEIGLSGLVQLITAGMGSPFLGDFEGVDEDTGNLMFSLEANNLVDEDGNSKQTQAPYFESGWVDEEDLKKQGEGFKFPWQK